MLITDQETIERYYQALLNREESFVGIFFAGVKTTSIFCISTCRARKPKPENVEFYTDFKDALDNGYRPCKICKPTQNAEQAPPQVEQAINLVKENPKDKITNYQLKQLDISPEKVRRWFKKHYGMTFQTYQRMYRINNAFQELKQGKTTTNIAFDSSYQSLSGFGYAYKKLIGQSPKMSSDKDVILINRLTTPLGPMFVCATYQGICLLEFVDRRMLETEFKDLQRLLQAEIISGENKYIKQAKIEVDEYFAGTRKYFTVELDTPGTNFDKRVWQHLQQLPYGETTTYKNIAKNIAISMNNTTSVKSVASANGKNRVSIIIPCHRIIAEEGNLMGYGGGIERKRWLIQHEQSNL